MVLCVGDQVCITDGPEAGWVGEVVLVGPRILLINLTTDWSRWFSQENCKLVVPYGLQDDVGRPPVAGEGDLVEGAGQPQGSMEEGPASDTEVDDLVAMGFVVTVAL